MWKRLLTSAIFLFGIVCFVLLRGVSTIFFDVFITLICTIGAYEVSLVLKKKGNHNNTIMAMIFPALLLSLYTISLHFNLHFLAVILLQIILCAVFLLLVYIFPLFNKSDTRTKMLKNNIEGSVNRYAWKNTLNTGFVLVYPTFLLAMTYFLNNFNVISFKNATEIMSGADMGLFFIVLTFAITMCTDTFAYAVGMVFKGKKLCPKISPNKTISGSIGGLFGAIFSSVVIYSIFNSINSYNFVFYGMGLNVWLFVFLGLIMGVLGQLGDLTASLIKRKADVKDYGYIFPGHGGVMDRFDAFSFNATFMALFFLIFCAVI